MYVIGTNGDWKIKHTILLAQGSYSNDCSHYLPLFAILDLRTFFIYDYLNMNSSCRAAVPNVYTLAQFNTMMFSAKR